MLLLFTLVLTVNNLRPADTTTTAHDELRREIQALREETDTLRLQSALRNQPSAVVPYALPAAPQVTPTQSVPLPAVPSSSTRPLDDEKAKLVAELERQLADSEEENEELSKKVEKAERRQEVAEKEAGLAYEERTKASQKRTRAMRQIEMAMKLGTIAEVNTEWGFIVFEGIEGREFSTGQILGIRRNSGILGLIRVEDHSQGNSYTGTILPNSYAGSAVPVKPGDELILPPDSFVAKNPAAAGSASTPSRRSNALPSNEPMLELPVGP